MYKRADNLQIDKSEFVTVQDFSSTCEVSEEKFREIWDKGGWHSSGFCSSGDTTLFLTTGEKGRYGLEGVNNIRSSFRPPESTAYGYHKAVRFIKNVTVLPNDWQEVFIHDAGYYGKMGKGVLVARRNRDGTVQLFRIPNNNKR